VTNIDTGKRSTGYQARRESDDVKPTTGITHRAFVAGTGERSGSGRMPPVETDLTTPGGGAMTTFAGRREIDWTNIVLASLRFSTGRVSVR